LTLTSLLNRNVFLQAKQLFSILMEGFATFEEVNLLKMSGTTPELGMVD
jgi:hypothetical protein